ncbi:hypothetical protein DBN41_02295 [Clostridioides difficile]|nr:hypothetical protein CDIF28670_00991 [Clostridioides difficile]EGT3754096.1 hypothetical protein [Clostridioides difficile]EGT3919668.1 hypothetical protein [Clostridioides difficile]EGT4172719.1 hypothetical protein [Clostridioides difficile]EGT4178536.1 hypothetical protein [Clostridioides difficile]
MLYKILHYFSKYNLVLLVYFLILYAVFKLVYASYVTLILTTLLYILLIKKNILVFDSSWLERRR